MRSASRTNAVRLLVVVVIGAALTLTVTGSTYAACLSFGCEGGSYDGSGGSTGSGGNSTLGVAVSSPKPGAVVSGIVSNVTAQISGTKQQYVNRVEFFFDGILFATDTTNPFKVDWNTLDATYPAYDGYHQLTAVAYDGHGWAASAPVGVTVANTSGTKYRATFSSPDLPQTTGYDPSLGTQPTVPVTVMVTNTSMYTWPASSIRLYYRWYSPDSTPVVTTTAAPAFTSDVPPYASRTIVVPVVPPTLEVGVDRAQYRLRFDLAEFGSTWFATKGNPPLENPVIDNKALEAEALGIEPYYQYVNDPVGAGMTHLVNVANGNSLLRWTSMQAVGRGISTITDITYNSLEKKTESPLGNNFSLGISTLMRLGLPLDIHPNNADTNCPNTTSCWIAFTDADGTRHKFTGHTATDGTIWWEEPAGLHLYLRRYSATDATKRWAITRPDGVTYFFDSGGYPTSVSDRNGNVLTYTLENVSSADDPGGVAERITRVTDAGGRSFSLDYYTKNEVKKPQMRGKLQMLTDHLGHTLSFEYYADGNLLRISQAGGFNPDGTYVPDRSFVFTYTTSDGSGPAIPNPGLRIDPDPATANQSTRLYSVRDPRGNETIFTYYGPGSSQDRWKLQATTDRSGVATGYVYDNVNRITTVTAPLSRVTKYAYDTGGKVTSITDPLQRVTGQAWNADLQLTTVTEQATGGVTTYAYNDNGLMTDRTDQVGNHTVWTYADSAVDGNDVAGKWAPRRTTPHISDLASMTTPKGVASTTVGDYTTTYTTDGNGNVTRITDPTGAFTSTTYNTDGTAATSTDANGNITNYTSYDPSGQPARIVDAAGGVEQRGYDANGNVIWIQDPLHANDSGADVSSYRTYFDYDPFARLERMTSPKSTAQARGTLIVSRTDFDANDNIVGTYRAGYGGPGSETTLTYDRMDRLTLSTSPDTSIDPNGERTQYDYDTAGRLIKQTDPRGMLTTNTANDFATVFAYDAADQLTSTTQYLVDSAGNITETLNSFYCYTVGGDMRWYVSPRANLASIDCTAQTPPAFTTSHTYDLAHEERSTTDPAARTTSTTYDANGNVATETDENGNVSTKGYDQRDELTSVTTPFDTTVSPPRMLTTIYQYDPFGNVKREISPRAYDASGDKVIFTDYVTSYVYDKLERVIRTDLPTSSAYPTPQYIHRGYDAVGDLTLYTLPATSPDPGGVATNKKMILTYLDEGWADTSKTPHLPRLHYNYAADGQQSSRTPEDPSGNLDTAHSETWTYDVDGRSKTYVDRAGRTTTHGYDVNSNLTSAVHTSVPPGNGITVGYSYDGLDRPSKLTTKREQDVNDVFSTYSYDENDNVAHREENGVEDANGNVVTSGRKIDFTWDPDDELAQQLDYGWTAASSDDARITKMYWPTGVVKTSTLERPVGGAWGVDSSSTYTYNADDSTANVTTKNGAGATIESHALSYLDANNQYVNGNVTQDVSMLVGPNTSAPCRTSTCTSAYVYDPRERLVQLQTVRNAVTSTTNYTLDTAGNVMLLDANGDQTSFTYNGDQLATRTHGTDARKYWYDWFGNLDCVTKGSGAAPDCNTPSPNVLAEYGYDAVDRLKSVRTFTLAGARDRTTDYTYDVLNRVARRNEAHGMGAMRTTSFTYLDVSDLVNSEQAKDSTGGVLNTKDFSFDADNTPYDLTATPLNGTGTRYDYAYDAHDSASLLVAPNGNAAASYGYTPYGSRDEALSSGDDSPDYPTNPVRYTGDRYDSGSGHLAMGPRQFSTDDAHYLQEDQLSQSTDDADLTQSGPDQNRYALAGGNPVNFRDNDGHMVVPDGGGGGVAPTRKKRRLYVNPFRGVSALRPGRTDQGVDYNGIGPFRAIGDARLEGDSYTSGWYGHFLRYKLRNGRHAGRRIYIAESIVDVRTHGLVSRGTVIARFGPHARPTGSNTFPGTEMGWASPVMNVSWAKYSYPQLGSNHNNLPAGKAFARFLRHLGVRTECNPGAGPEWVGYVKEIPNPPYGC
jgi:RHS repeat-associated protein